MQDTVDGKPQTNMADSLDDSVDDSAERLRIAVGRLHRMLRISSHDGLTPSQVAVLASLSRNGPTRLSDLAEEEGLHPSMLSRIVGRCETDGMLARRADERDRRAAVVELTPAGERALDRIRRSRTAALAARLDCLSGQQRAEVLAALPALESLSLLAHVCDADLPGSPQQGLAGPPSAEPPDAGAVARAHDTTAAQAVPVAAGAAR